MLQDKEHDRWPSKEEFEHRDWLWEQLNKELTELKPWRATLQLGDVHHSKSRGGRRDRKHRVSFCYRVYVKDRLKADQQHPVEHWFPDGSEDVPRIRSITLEASIEGSVYYTAWRLKHVQDGANPFVSNSEAIRRVDSRFAGNPPSSSSAGEEPERKTMARRVLDETARIFEPEHAETSRLLIREIRRQTSSDSEVGLEPPQKSQRKGPD